MTGIQKDNLQQSLSARGVADALDAKLWLGDKGIEDIECITPDIAGVPRGKMMPSPKFLGSTALAFPTSVFMQTISGEYPEESDTFEYPATDGDLRLQPDLSTLSRVPWETDPTAQVICDIVSHTGATIDYGPRSVLKRVVAAYADKGWKPVIAPEMEFYLVQAEGDPNQPLQAPIGRSGRRLGGGSSYSIASINEFDDLIDDIYDFSEAQGLEIETLIHEEGAGQLEINLNHGDPLELADQVFMFKRTIREAALKHGMYATFMAKPIQSQPGSAMHIHQSVVDLESGKNIFSNAEGKESELFHSFIGGLQRYLPNTLVMMAPYVNSYRRLTTGGSAPVNVQWGYDNRTTGLRVPTSEPEARRVENRIPSSDTNPYLAIAGSLAAGYLGMVGGLKPEPAVTTTANEGQIDLPRGLLEAVQLLEDEEALVPLLGSDFISVYAAIKKQEFETFMRVISPWEREYLLMNA
ncbi:glutamine synthetase family protein [Pseudahrensia aquimaris]|uniref:Glutamine synthetase family protein n=1 Tax=Pseudahrensia aquimaris TaxID=744461 RepID=A0ABW3FFE4_9HYPH